MNKYLAAILALFVTFEANAQSPFSFFGDLFPGFGQDGQKGSGVPGQGDRGGQDGQMGSGVPDRGDRYGQDGQMGSAPRRQDAPDNPVKFDYNVDFEYLFNNYEFGDGDSQGPYDESRTINAARLTPTVGLAIRQKPNVVHRVSAGIDLLREMGSGLPAGDVFRELTLNYSAAVELEKGRFDAVAGIFPRRFSEFDWTGPFYDDANLFYDNNLEGVYFKWRSRKFHAELGLDWNGQHGDDANPDRREQFKVLSAGQWNFAGGFSLAWNAQFHHFACSQVDYNLVDDHMVNPRLEWCTDKAWFDRLKVTAGVVVAFQNDRKAEGDPQTPWGLTSTQEISKFGIRIHNYLFWGEDLMPYYQKYGSSLYSGEECFHTQFDGKSVVDILRISWEPRITDWLAVTVACHFHLGTSDADNGIKTLRGSQQILGLRLNLDRFRTQPVRLMQDGPADGNRKHQRHNKKHHPKFSVDTYEF